MTDPLHPWTMPLWRILGFAEIKIRAGAGMVFVQRDLMEGEPGSDVTEATHGRVDKLAVSRWPIGTVLGLPNLDVMIHEEQKSNVRYGAGLDQTAWKAHEQAGVPLERIWEIDGELHGADYQLEDDVDAYFGQTLVSPAGLLTHAMTVEQLQEPSSHFPSILAMMLKNETDEFYHQERFHIDYIEMMGKLYEGLVMKQGDDG